MRFVHIADVHIGMSFTTASFGKTFGDVKRQAIKDNLAGVIRYIKEENVDVLFIAGDFFESDYVELSDLHDINYLFSQIPSTTIILQAGNHDPLSVSNGIYERINWCDHVIIMEDDYEEIPLDAYGVSVVGLSWNSKGPMYFDKDLFERVYKQTKYEQKVVLLHGDLYNDNEYLALNKKYLQSLEADYIGLGHIHKPDLTEVNIVYPGSLEPLDFSEGGDHGFIAGTLLNSMVDYEFIPSAIYPFYVEEVNVSGIQSNFECVFKINEMLDKFNGESFILRLVMTGEKESQIDFLEVKKGLKFKDNYIEMVNETVPVMDLEALEANHEEDLIGYFIKEMKTMDLDDPVNKKSLEVGLKLLMEDAPDDY